MIFRIEVRNLWGGWSLVDRRRGADAAEAAVYLLTVQGIAARIVND